MNDNNEIVHVHPWNMQKNIHTVPYKTLFFFRTSVCGDCLFRRFNEISPTFLDVFPVTASILYLKPVNYWREQEGECVTKMRVTSNCGQ